VNKNEEKEPVELDETNKKALDEVVLKIYFYQKLSEYISKNMKSERHNTFLKIEEFLVKLKDLKDKIRFGEKKSTVEEVKKSFPDEYDIKFLTGTSLGEKDKKINNAKQIIQKTLNNIKERSLKNEVFSHFKPIVQYLNQIQNKKYELFPLIVGEEKPFSLRVVNRKIQKGDLVFTVRRITNCPEKRFFFIKAELEYRGETNVYESKINKEGGDMGHTHTFNLESGRKINHSKLNSAKLRISIHKQHRLFLFKYRLVSEIDLDLKRLNRETNAIYNVQFPYKDNKTLDVEITMQTHEALQGNTIKLKLLTIKKKFPPITFMRERSEISSSIGK
jgi:hypothetical protein